MAQEIIDKDETAKERKYADALSLQSAVSCVVRFEYKVRTLRLASKKFLALGDYKDAKERAEACRKAADRAEQEGYKQICALAGKIEQRAKTKQDYLSAIEQYRRLKKSEDFTEKIKPRIQACKQQIGRIETRAAWKRRLIALLFLFVFVLLFMQSSLYPFLKGYYHRSKGQYNAAAADFKAAKGLPWQKGQLHKTYYLKGKECLAAGRKKQGMHYLRMARTVKTAQEELLILELEHLRSSKAGDETRFGYADWLVLDVNTDTAILTILGEGYDCPYDNGEAADWQETAIYKWLNGPFLKRALSGVEKYAIYKENREEQRDAEESGKKQKGEVTLLNRSLYMEYQSLLREKIPELSEESWWLCEGTDSPVIAYFVNASGGIEATRTDDERCKARPVIMVNISK